MPTGSVEPRGKFRCRLVERQCRQTEIRYYVLRNCIAIRFKHRRMILVERRLELPDDLTFVVRSERLPDRQTNVLADKPAAAIPQQDVNPADVLAAGTQRHLAVIPG
jgi:hypothetical protein